MVTVVCELVITLGVTEEKVGLVSVVSVSDPPKDTEEPLIVIAEDASFVIAMAAELLISALAIVPSNILAVVTALSSMLVVCICAPCKSTGVEPI
jgi:hypothetical protein